MVDKGEINYFLEMCINRDWENKTLSICQPNYIETVLEQFGMTNCNPVATPIESGVKYDRREEKKLCLMVDYVNQTRHCCRRAYSRIANQLKFRTTKWEIKIKDSTRIQEQERAGAPCCCGTFSYTGENGRRDEKNTWTRYYLQAD